MLRPASPLRHLPNLISALRMVLVVPIVWALLDRRLELAIGLFLVAGVSDAVDGFLAKQFGWASRLGGILDALADKFLLVSTFLCLWWLGVFPGWLVLWVLARDVLIIGGGIVYNSWIERFVPEPSPVSKLNTFLQIVLAALGVVHLGITPVADWLLHVLMGAVALTVFFSGAGYVREWTRRAALRRHARDGASHGE
ncbi:CDP-alcohol phosphatidyltransferase family protein [endosymbiont of unidentified scaly snail isolate Monju]|uniref:CDP-alcohol phosphatidyltransferase family protein n=1 Tax=endosymbiont of unidentified scaly snail isolate Monju TaxID=1248727 RepID=UPI000389211F|nr:CDP-alcohol phosphatidyltransferase family protein [endosymbiont of unidentified scaly snail isolate Monju]BAN68687.1 CDP-diacylglycerol--glycerol-3-phosphate 3-phosphatidyltransferase [endosymbiont of unidentified scaly snail isolate Monju]